MKPTRHPLDRYRFLIVHRDMSPHNLTAGPRVQCDSSLAPVHQTVQSAFG